MDIEQNNTDPDTPPSLEDLDYAEVGELITDRVSNVTDELPVKIEGRWVKVKIRALSRQEMLEAGGSTDTRTVEQQMLSRAMIKPTMTVAQIAAWQKSSPATEMQPIVKAVNRLSGVRRGATKSLVDGPGDQSGS